MKPEAARDQRWFCSNPVAMRLEGGHAVRGQDAADRVAVVVFNTAAIVSLTANRRIPA